MGKRSKKAKRCDRCRVHIEQCICAQIPQLQLKTKIALIMHRREVSKPTATGPLALAALPNSDLYIHGNRENPLDLNHLLEEDRRVLLLYPSADAIPLSKQFCEQDPRPITLIVPDGSWGQASRYQKRIPGLSSLQAVTLPQKAPTEWGIRRESTVFGLATFEAITRALGFLESTQIQDKLEQIFRLLVKTTLASRGSIEPVPIQPKVINDQNENSTQQKTIVEDSPQAILLPILYQDEDILVINKPSGQAVHRGWAKDTTPIVQTLENQIGRKVFPIHRLDRGTSGVLIFALSSSVAKEMQLNWTENFKKRYLALCRGYSGSLTQIDYPLAKHKGAEKRPAITNFKLLNTFERYGLYEVFPQNGRVHQIRRHLKHASHPIIGDTVHGKGEHNRIFRERFGLHRLALHCQKISFTHPRSSKQVQIEAPLPTDLKTLFARTKLLPSQ